VNRAQNERADVFRLHEEISRNIQENTRRLDKLLMLHSTTMTGVRTPMVRPDKSAILTLIKAIERLDKLRETTGISPVELEEKKRDLVEEFVGHF
jgi:hypothetical protein